jgi:hypothetical protein
MYHSIYGKLMRQWIAEWNISDIPERSTSSVSSIGRKIIIRRRENSPVPVSDKTGSIIEFLELFWMWMFAGKSEFSGRLDSMRPLEDAVGGRALAWD